MKRPCTKALVATSVSLLLFLGAVPERMSWEGGVYGIPQAHAAGERGSGHASGGSGGGREGGSHSDDRHTDDHGDTHDHDDSGGGHESGSGGKGKGPAYHGGRSGSSKGRGGPSRMVIERILESE